MSAFLHVDHVGLRVPNLAAEVEGWSQRGHVATYQDSLMAIIPLEGGIRIALLGPGSVHPSHLALVEPNLDQFHRIAKLAEVEPTVKEDGTRTFYTQGGVGLALEWIWRPGETT